MVTRKEFKAFPLWKKIIVAIACFKIGFELQSNSQLAFIIGYDLKTFGKAGGFEFGIGTKQIQIGDF